MAYRDSTAKKVRERKATKIADMGRLAIIANNEQVIKGLRTSAESQNEAAQIAVWMNSQMRNLGPIVPYVSRMTKNEA